MATLKTIDRDNPFNTSDGNLRINFSYGVSAVKQTISSRIKSFKTEFYYNKNFGPNWYEVILNPASQPIERESELNDMVAGTTGVNALISSNLLVDKVNQSQYYTSQVVSDGQIIDVVEEIDDGQ